MIRRAFLVVLGACTLAPALAAGPDVRVENAWVRPANSGQAATPLYAEISSDAALKLVGAASEAAKGAALYVSKLEGERAIGMPIAALDVPAGGKLRLAPRGAFVELRDIQRLVRTGDSVPFTLEFTAADGKALRVNAQAVVRGIMPRPTDRADGTSDAAATPSSDGVPMPGTGN